MRFPSGDFKSPASAVSPPGRKREERPRGRSSSLISPVSPIGPRAGNGTRTRDPNLGKVVLYQLSYSRVQGRLVRGGLGYKRGDGGASSEDRGARTPKGSRDSGHRTEDLRWEFEGAA